MPDKTRTAKLSDDEVALLGEPVLAHLATTGPDGRPHVTPVWVDTDGEAILINTAKGRVKHRNLAQNAAVAVSVNDPSNFYRTVVARGHADLVDEGADAHIDKLAKKYLGKDEYPWRKPGEERVIVRIVPEEIIRQG